MLSSFVPDSGLTPTRLIDVDSSAGTPLPLFVQLSGIPGESVNAHHADWQDALAFEWAADLGTAAPNSTTLQEFVVEAGLDRASPPLFAASIEGTVLTQVIVEATLPSATNKRFARWVMQDVRIGGYQVAQGADGSPVVEYRLNPQFVEYEYYVYGPTGTLQGVVESTWDSGNPATGVMLDTNLETTRLIGVGPGPDVPRPLYVQIPGIPGESNEASHAGWQEALAFEWAADSLTDGSGLPAIHEFVVVANLDRASPPLFESLVEGTVLSQIIVEAAVSASVPDRPLARWLLDDVRIGGYQIAQDQIGSPVVEYRLTAQAVEFEYYHYDSFGALEEIVEATWDAVQTPAVLADSGLSPPRLIDTAPLSGTTRPLYVLLPGIPGESANAHHANWQEALSFEWGADQQSNGASAPTILEFVVVARLDRTSPRLFEASIEGTMLSQVIVEAAVSSANTNKRLARWLLDDVQVSSYQIGHDVGGSPVVEYRLSSQAIEYEYYVYNSSGSLQGVVEATWDAAQIPANLPDSGLSTPRLIEPAPLSEVPRPLYVLLPGMPGESTNAHHAAWQDALALEWGADSLADGSGLPTVHEFVIAANLDRAAPALFKAWNLGTVLSQVIVETALSGSNTDKRFARWLLNDAQVSAMQFGHDSDGTPLVEYRLSSQAIEFEYYRYNSSGALLEVVETTWDVVQSPAAMPDSGLAPTRLIEALPGGGTARPLFVQISGIPGESKNAFHVDWQDATAFEWGVDALTDAPGQSTVHEFVVAAALDRASPLLFEASVEGTELPQVIVEATVSPSSTNRRFVRWVLSDVRIGAYQLGQDPAGSPVVEYRLSPQSVELEYYRYNSSGVLQGVEEWTWDASQTPAELLDEGLSPTRMIEAAPDFGAPGPLFVFIPGIPGESNHVDHEDWQEAMAFEWGTDQFMDGASSVAVHEFVLAASLDKASPLLFEASVEGLVLPQVIVEMTVPDMSMPLARWLLNDVRIGAYQVGQDDDGSPLVEYRLNPEGIEYEYYVYDSNGSLEEIVEATWQVAEFDLSIEGFEADGSETLELTYTVTGSAAAEFEISIYRSNDATFGGDELLAVIPIDAPLDLGIGQHTLPYAIGSGAGRAALPGAGIGETDSDYYILAVIDVEDDVVESDTDPWSEDNTAAFSGVYHPANAQVFVHGRDVADAIEIRPGSIEVDLNGEVHVYPNASVKGLRIRAHGGDDAVDGTGVNKGMWIFGGDGFDALVGGTAGDRLIGGPDDDILAGGNGSDSYLFDADAQLGLDSIADSAGTDLLDFSATTTLGVSIDIGSTVQQSLNANLKLTLSAGNAIETLVGTPLADTLTGNGQANTITGGAGNDGLSGRGGNDKFLFDADSPLGSDTLADSGGTDLIDFVTTTTKTVTLNLSSTAAQAVNSNLTLTLSSGSAIENVTGGAKDNLLTGNTLDNVLIGGKANDTLTGGDGNDSLNGAAGNDTLNGGNQNDTLTPGGGADTATGGSGNDKYVFDVDAALGSDTLNESGGGIDTLDFSATGNKPLTVNLATAGAQTVHSPNLTLTLGSGSTFENAIGGKGGDTLTGNTLDNQLTGGAGNDALTGAAGDDTYIFDADAQLNTDTLNESGGGFDTLDFSATGAQAVTVNLATAGAQPVSSFLTLNLSSATTFEKVIGGNKNDNLTGNSLANILLGGGGIDTLSGAGDRDLLIGGLAADILNGNAGSDILIAGTTSHDNNADNLEAILTAWLGPGNYTSRTTALRDGTGVSQLKANVTAFNDTGADNLTGGSEEDWYFKAVADVLNDLAGGELVEVLV